MRSADMNERRQFARPAIVDGVLPLWALCPLEDLQAPMVLTGTLRNWNPRPACGTAISSVRISILPTSGPSFSGRLVMRYGSLVVPVHLVSPSPPPLTHLSCRVSFSCLRLFVPFARAHAH